MQAQATIIYHRGKVKLANAELGDFSPNARAYVEKLMRTFKRDMDVLRRDPQTKTDYGSLELTIMPDTKLD
jgi:hypothetical protein